MANGGSGAKWIAGNRTLLDFSFVKKDLSQKNQNIFTNVMINVSVTKNYSFTSFVLFTK